jgi:hypothetical protein
MTALESLQQTLAGEHAAVYVLGTLGARVSRSDEPALADRITAAYDAHRARRDQLTAAVRDLHGRPVPSEVSYELPNRARTPTQLREAARLTELRCSVGYAALVAATSGAGRQLAIEALTDTAVRLLGFGQAPVAFPGAPEL